MIVDLLRAGRTARELSDEYNVEYSNITRWNRESKSGGFTARKELSPQ
ncbi:hypothetical protein [Flavivirga jejuensis]|uniref:Transposase n=1 Tax=Flavivirga jejuensis TaxID=870487 RepID=A0ABT8WST7_9FLAO|nr:hypothetical protein [Flavivirga jejuensis]MDO5976247.1 hypothetical protein [Flavivirga jejuensis]